MPMRRKERELVEKRANELKTDGKRVNAQKIPVASLGEIILTVGRISVDTDGQPNQLL